ncbi:MAG: hypothetical protein ACXAC7_02920 [Candidatus Hodarchaeales archaeon]|jgi:methionine synthase II (cobalamin-independent)
MKINASLTGIHPYNESTIQAIFDYKYGRTDKTPLQMEIKNDLKELIQNVKEWQYVSTGNYGWFDLIRPFSLHLKEGLSVVDKADDLPVTRNPLTNTFYRQPTVVGKIKVNSRILNQNHPIFEENGYLQTNYLPSDGKSKTWTQILPGPFYFASQVEYTTEGKQIYPSDVECANDFVKILVNEIKYLREEGYTQIILDESPIVWAQKTGKPLTNNIIENQVRLLNEIVAKTNIKIIVYYHNGNITQTPTDDTKSLLEALMLSKVHGIGVDFFHTPIKDILDKNFSGKTLFAGLIDATSYSRTPEGDVVIENSADVKDAFTSLKSTQAEELVLCPSTRMELIPRSIADQKINLITKIIQEVVL